MDEQPITIGRFLWEYLVAFILILCGMRLAGILADFISLESSFVYGLCLGPSLVPFLLWLRHCGVGNFDGWELGGILLVMLGVALAQEFAPAQLKDNNIFLGATSGVLFWLIGSAIRRLWNNSSTP